MKVSESSDNYERSFRNINQGSSERRYWLNKLSGDLVKTSFPFDPYKANQHKPGQESLSFSFTGQIFSRLMRLSNDSDIRLYIILMTLVVLLLEKYTGNKDIMVGAPIYRQDIERDFVNKIVVLRNRLQENMSFKELLLQVSQTNFEAMEHINYPLETIPYELNMPFSEKEFPLFDVAILLENLHEKSYIKHLSLNVIFSFTRKDNCIEGHVEYNHSLYRQETVKQIISHLNNLAERALNNIDTSLVNLFVMSDMEIKQLVKDVNATQVTSRGYPTGKMIQQLFQEQVHKTPNHIALQYKDHHLTYKKVENTSSRLARCLTDCGVQGETIVAILLKNSMELISAILAVLKTGASYLPIDPGYLTPRVNYMLADSQTYHLITNKDFREKFQFKGAHRTIIYVEHLELWQNIPGCDSDDWPPAIPNYASPQERLAYVMYTSGSTGKPKGVMVHHSSLVNYVWWAAQTYVRGETLMFPLYSSISFDLTVTSIFTPLITGNTIVIYRGGESNFLIEEIIDENKVGIIKLTPSHLYLIKYKNLQLSRVKRFIVGGEIFETRIARQIYDKFNGKIEIYNEYGPTEATVGCLIYQFNPGKDTNTSVPIGVPIAETQIYLLDSNYRPVPIGVSGEIYVSGKGVARGYLNSPELTAEKFIKLEIKVQKEEPWQQVPKKHLSHMTYTYRTGDLARWLPVRNLEFLGRVDQQVKIRGYRIELSEIEHKLLTHKQIKEALVIARDSQEKNASDEKQDQYLCAYLVSAGELQVSELREFLLRDLPDYMVPLFFVPLEAIPLTANGKVNRKALPVPGIKKESNYVAPRDEREKKLVDIWAKVLRIDSSVISIDASFFELGGQSLKQVHLISQIHKEFNVKVPLAELFNNQTIRELYRYIKGAVEDKYLSIEPVEKKEYYELSSTQRRVYFLQQMDPENTVYNVPHLVTLSMEVDMEKVRRVFQHMARRHESLRTSFIMVEDRCVQKINRNVDIEIEYYDLGSKYELDKAPGDNPIKEILNRFIRHFDLSKAPLFRPGLIRLEGEKFMLMVDVHHIIGDGVSTGIMTRQFTEVYGGDRIRELRLQYRDYAHWQNSKTVKDRVKVQGEYWMKEFEKDIPVLSLPTDYQRPAAQSFEGSAVELEINKEETAALNQLAISQETTLYMVIIAAFNILLSKLSSQEDIVIGTPVVARRHVDLDEIIGVFVNTLALRNYPQDKKKFNDFLHEVKINALQAFENQEYQFEDLVEALPVDRNVGRNPLFDVMFSWFSYIHNDDPGPQLELASEKNPFEFEIQTAKFDMNWNGGDSEEGIFFVIEYCTKLFKEKTILRFANCFKRIISAIVKSPYLEISQIEIIPVEEKKRILYDFNDTAAGYPKDKTISQLFEDQVNNLPDNIAVVGVAPEGTGGLTPLPISMSITYNELNEQSDHLAYLLQTKNIKPDTIVGIMVERSIEMIIGIMGILKSGGAYMPIEPGYPQERIDYMLKDSSAKILLTGQEIAGFSSPQTLYLSEGRSFTNDQCPMTNDQLAYIIYTSGSTGKPKGVMVKHCSLVNTLFALFKEYPFSERDAYLFKTSYIFDVSVSEIFGWSWKGGRLIILEKDAEKEPGKILEEIERNNITHINFVPSMFNAFIENLNEQNISKLSSLRYIFLAGEELLCAPVQTFKKFTSNIALENIYGPTEATIYASKYSLQDWKNTERIPIGKPLQNMKMYILDKHNGIQPIEIPGELCIAGLGLARGYLNNPELTAEKFDHDLWDYLDYQDEKQKVPGKKSTRSHLSCLSYIAHPSYVYHTGDLARWLPDGNIEFLGRIDHQVKIRGFRIELGEIEYHLLNYNEINEAVVAAKKDKNGDTYLCAYIVSKKEFTVSQLRSHLSERLPDYMLPSFFMPLEKIPLTPGGKVDKKSLPEPGTMDLSSDMVYVGPGNIIEKILVEIWQKVLGINTISINDNFFEIGGDSIKTIQIVSRMKRSGYKVEMRDIFRNPRISELAPWVKKIERFIDQLTIIGTVPLTPIQEWFFKNNKTENHHFNQAVMLHFEEGVEEEALKSVFSKLQEHHDALRMIYKKNNGKIMQVNQGLDHSLSLQVFDYRNRGDSGSIIEVKVNEIQASINLETGPLMKLGLFKMDNGDRLLIVIHHLVIDGVSWRILFEDIETLYRQYKKNKQLALPLKTDSFKVWSEKLCEYANSDQFLKGKNYWVELESKSISQIRKDFENEKNYMKDVETLSFSLAETETHLLLTKVNEAFGTGINDILLAALGLGIKKTFGNDRLLIALEGHGREEILEDIDVSRTVSWFTSLYPVLLDFSYENEDYPDRNFTRQIKEVKESLRQVPHKGLGYGILKYLTAEKNKEGIHFTLNPQVIFNYLGQFDEDLEHRSYRIAKESVGYTCSRDQQREFELEFSGIITNKRLTISISYSIKQYKQEIITELLEHFKRELVHIITYCSSRETKELTPSDLTYPELSIETFDRLQEQYSYLIEDVYPLTPMQEGMLFYALFENKNRATYFEQMSYRLQGELNVPLVEKSLNELFKRHDVLRTVFIHEGLNRPLQVVLKERNVEFCFEDLRKSLSDRESKEKLVNRFNDKDRLRAFDLSKDVLMRVAVLQLEDSEYQVTWSSHHILMDGWCIGILISEFFEIYTNYLENSTFQQTKIKPYRTYIQWLEKQEKNKSRNYWKNYLENYEEIASVPKKKNTLIFEGGYKGAGASIRFEEDKTIALNKVAIRSHVTLNTVLQVIWAIALGKYCSKQDIVFGVLISGRPPEIEEVESMIGCFINTIPIRITFDGKTKLNELIRIVQDRAIESEPHYYYSLAEIQAESALKQNLLDHIIEFQNYPPAERIEGVGDQIRKNKPTEALKLSNVTVHEQSNYDFNIIIIPGKQIYLGFSYNANVYDSQLVEQLGLNCIRVLEQIIEDDKITIDEIAFLSEEERKKILFEFNNNRTDFPRDKTIYQFVEKHAEITPDRIAIVGGNQLTVGKEVHRDQGVGTRFIASATYRELNERVNQLEKVLSNSGVQKDEPVGILMERSHAMVEGILATWKAGGAYMPIDPGYPEERIDHLLSDCQAKILLTTKNMAKAIEFDKEVIYLDSPWPPASLNLSEGRHPDFPASRLPGFSASLPSSLAYIIYTSGSSGKPKGVMIEHIGMMNHIQAKINDLQLTPESIVAQNATHTFDISIWQFFAALTVGGQTVIYPDELIMDPGRFLSRLVKDQITILELVPSYLSVLLDYTVEQGTLTLPLSLQFLLVTGEELKPYLVKKWFDKYPAIKMVNAYGPTEASDDITHYIMDKAPGMERIPIGRPLQNMNIYILDHRMQLCPIGVKGEICVSGVGVGRGYLGDEEKTKQFFIENPFISPIANESSSSFTNDQCPMTNDRSSNPSHSTTPPLTTHHSPYSPYSTIYLTGDLGSWLPDGNILFFGRKDNQVKIRGFRIELGEIENRLLNHPGIKEAVVIDKEDKVGNKYLCAYVVPRPNHSPGAATLKEYLLKHLPDYMIPAHFMLLENIPLTSSGKLDRKSLPEPESSEIISGYVAPGNQVEKKLVEIWSEILGKEEGVIGVNHSFFDLGGHSLKAIVLVSKIHKELNVKVPLAELFKTPFVRDLALFIQKNEKVEFLDLEPMEEKEYYEASFSQQRLWIISQFEPNSSAYNTSTNIILRHEIDENIIRKVLYKIVERHESLRTQFVIIDDKIFQRVVKWFEIPIKKMDLSGLHQEKKQQRRQQVYVEEATVPIDLLKFPLFRVTLLKLAEAEFEFIITLNHIITDGWSMGILVREIPLLYEAFEHGREVKLEPLRLQYKDFTQWQNQQLTNTSFKQKAHQFWEKIIKAGIPPVELPIDSRDNRNRKPGATYRCVINNDIKERLNKLALENHTTLFIVMFSIYNLMLSHLLEQDDITCGIISAGREHLDLKNIVGYFINPVLFKCHLDQKESFNDFLQRMSWEVLETFRYQSYPLELVCEELKMKYPDISVAFNMLNIQDLTANTKLENLESYHRENFTDAKFNLEIYATQYKNGIEMSCVYKESLFQPSTIEYIINTYVKLMDNISAEQDN